MSAPRPTMKTIQKRFCTALPRAVSSSASSSASAISRVRSNSAPSSRSLYTANTSSGPLAFFDSPPPPPPPSSRPGNPHILSTSRLPVKAEGESSTTGPHSHTSPHGQGHSSGQPPFSLALTSPQPNASSPPVTPASHQSAGFFPYSSFAPIPFCNVSLSDQSDLHPRVKRHRVRYHLDVGAYGIPKHAKKPVRSGMGNAGVPSGGRFFQDIPMEDLSLAVQVGEDAYFVRENAMGVADGVGGWSRIRDSCVSKRAAHDPSPSALFARRLMHHCSAEALEADACASRRREASPARSVSPRRTGTTALNDAWPWNADMAELQEQLEDSLEELEDGLDVLMILERAYEKTMNAHVVADELTTTSLPAAQSPSLFPIPEDHTVAYSDTPPPEIPVVPQPRTVPLKTGSSTALVAVLQHSRPPSPPASSPHRPRLFSVSPRPTYDAVLKIAHLGDCMGMLIRGEHVAWRSAEMWQAFNMPVQLGPNSSARPSDAQILELPVQADDILILASDGLSDNLWDEEVLDEVVRFKKSFLKDAGPGALGKGLLGRRTLAGMLSEALCSRARRVSERTGGGFTDDEGYMEDEIPFARRAREQGKTFKGGKIDDISVLVAVVSPTPDFALN